MLGCLLLVLVCFLIASYVLASWSLHKMNLLLILYRYMLTVVVHYTSWQLRRCSSATYILARLPLLIYSDSPAHPLKALFLFFPGIFCVPCCFFLFRHIIPFSKSLHFLQKWGCDMERKLFIYSKYKEWYTLSCKIIVHVAGTLLALNNCHNLI